MTIDFHSSKEVHRLVDALDLAREQLIAEHAARQRWSQPLVPLSNEPGYVALTEMTTLRNRLGEILNDPTSYASLPRPTAAEWQLVGYAKMFLSSGLIDRLRCALRMDALPEELR